MGKVHIRPLRFNAGSKKGHFDFPEISKNYTSCQPEITNDKLK